MDIKTTERNHTHVTCFYYNVCALHISFDFVFLKISTRRNVISLGNYMYLLFEGYFIQSRDILDYNVFLWRLTFRSVPTSLINELLFFQTHTHSQLKKYNTNTKEYSLVYTNREKYKHVIYNT